MGGAFGQHHRIIGGPLMGIGSPRHRAGQWRSRCALERESEDKSLGGSLGKVFYGGGSRFSVRAVRLARASARASACARAESANECYEPTPISKEDSLSRATAFDHSMPGAL